MWFMVTDWLHGLLRASTFMHQHDSSISCHKLSVAWPNAKNVFVLSVCMQMNVCLCLHGWLLTYERHAKDLELAAIWFSSLKFSWASCSLYDFLSPQWLSVLVSVIFCFDPSHFDCLVIAVNWANFVLYYSFIVSFVFSLYLFIPLSPQPHIL